MNSGAVDNAGQTAIAAGNADQARAGEQYDWAKIVGNDVLGAAKNASGRDFKLADDFSATANDMQSRYRSIFQPVEDQSVKDATGYDSPEQMARVRQEAAGNANSAFDTAQASRAVQLSQMGVNPNSGRFGDATALTLARTGATADAMNRATADRNDRAIALRQGVASFGMNVNSAADRAREIALAATGAGSGVLNAAAGTTSALRTAPVAWSGAANALYGTGSNALLGLSNASTNQFNASTQRNSGAESEVGTVAKMIGILSSKRFKEDKRSLDKDKVLAGVRRLSVESWKYKKGIADEGDHIGPYAEDVQREFGDRVAPGGKVIDMISMIGVNLAALQALDSKVAGLEKAQRR